MNAQFEKMVLEEMAEMFTKSARQRYLANDLEGAMQDANNARYSLFMAKAREMEIEAFAAVHK